MLARNYWPRFSGGSPTVIKELLNVRILLLILPSLLFAANLALTNLGLFMTNVTAHLVLRNSDLVWIVILAFFFKAERPGLAGVLCCLVDVAGVVLVSLFVTQEVCSPLFV